MNVTSGHETRAPMPGDTRPACPGFRTGENAAAPVAGHSGLAKAESGFSDMDFALGHIDTVTANIEMFLSRQWYMHMPLENAEADDASLRQ